MSEQSDTPRTDALKIPSEALLLLGNKGVPAQIVKAILTLGDHARSLERELSEVARERNKLTVKLRPANAIVAVIDEWVRRNLIDARSALADARLDYGDPFSEGAVKAMLTDLQTEEHAKRVAAERELEELRGKLEATDLRLKMTQEALRQELATPHECATAPVSAVKGLET